MAVFLALNLAFVFLRKSYQIPIFLGVTVSAGLFVYCLMTGGVNQSAFVWYYVFPLIASFMLGSNRGAFASALFFLPAIFLFTLDDPPSYLADYSFDFKIRFTASYLVVAAFSYLFEHAREKSSKELQKAQAELECKVMERTTELKEANLRLEKQNIHLKQLDKMKEGLIRDATHELKTPVAKVAMELELLRGTIKDYDCPKREEAENTISIMESSIRRQQDVINNILNLSRLEAGGRKYKVYRVDVMRLIEDVVGDYDLMFQRLSIRVSKRLAEAEVDADGEMLRQVFSNLISNAIKYRRLEGATLDICLEEKDKAILVSIADNGIGLSGEEKEHVFDSFYQVSRSSEGVGVGLSISKKIIEDLGGQIWINSDGRNKGTAVSIMLPAR